MGGFKMKYDQLVSSLTNNNTEHEIIQHEKRFNPRRKGRTISESKSAKLLLLWY